MSFPLRIFFILCLFGYTACQPAETPVQHDKALRFQEALDEEFRRTYDPALGYPPKERLLTAIEQTHAMQLEVANRRSAQDLAPKFVQRGPSNIGGRTRTILIDLNDPERKKVFAGSVAGGLYVTEDITADPPNWKQVNDYLANMSIGGMAQDPNNPNIMYLGTGEGFPNADAVRGIGLFKSEDGGVTWNILPSTLNSVFNFTRAMVVHPVTSDIYVATRDGGIRKSDDGGQTWLKVLGISLSASSDNMYDLYHIGGKMFASNSTDVYRSDTGERGEWEDISLTQSGFPSNLSRCEMTVCGFDIDVLYAVGSIGGGASSIYRTDNGGQSWQTLSGPQGGDFTNGQAWYDLDIAVDPFDCSHVIVAGVPIYTSNNGGSSWNRFANNMHVDQHRVLFDPEQPGVIMFGNDGGVWRSENGSAQNVASKNAGYITTQYYGCAIHPDTFSNYFLGGTQDNGTHQLNASGVSTARNVWGGDGFLCHIDQNEPQYQMVSSQFGNWGLSTNGGITFSGGQTTNSNFLTPSDYDDDADILYTQTGDGDFYRWFVKTGILELGDFGIGAGGGISTIAVDPNTPNRVYFGTFGGTVVKVDNAHDAETLVAEVIQDVVGTISSIAVGNGSPDDLMLTMSNYGIATSVMVSRNGGENWENAEGNLPDMPIRWGIFSPKDPSEAMIATEAGVWSTDGLNGSATQWLPPVPGEGSPIVRTDQLQIRNSDFVVLAATHARGLWTSSVFAEPRPKLEAPQVHYVNSPLQFVGELSLNASSYFWEFGDGEVATDENPLHVYDQIGEYPVTLTINGELSTSITIKILPEVALPYEAGEPEYGGSFEGKTEQYGVHLTNGTPFERGKSEVPGKNGAKSGDNAFVLGVNDPFYQPNTHTELYLPTFDFSDESIYTFSFWARYDIDPGPDGFLVQYSKDRGQTWSNLGKRESGWYTFVNNDLPNSAFPDGTAYFTNVVGGYTNYKQNVSFLSGERDVAFKFVFRSDADGFHRGMAIDDVQITKFEGELETKLLSFDGEFVGGDKDIELRWSTRPEYHCQTFEVERSINGIEYEVLDVVNCEGGVTDQLQQYIHDSQGGRDLYFYRIKVINEDADNGYFLEYYSPTITIRRRFEGVEVFRAFPNPFVDHVNFTFTDRLQSEVAFELYDLNGRLIFESSELVNDVFYRLDMPPVPAGVYYLSVRIGEADEEIFQLLGGVSN